jgi:hypothetical protein
MSAAGSASFNVGPGLTTMVSRCDTNCDGIATVKFTKANSAGSKIILYTMRSVGNAVASLYVSGGTTNSTTVRLNDGTIVTTEFCYVNTIGGACVTDTVVLSGIQEVVCPGWVKLTFTGDCPCSGGVNFTFTLTSPVMGKRYYRATIVLNGSVVQTIDLINGVATATAPVMLSSNNRLVVQFVSYQYANHSGELRSGTLFDMSNNL